MFVWFKGKIIKKINKAKEKTKKSNIAIVNEKESNILSYDEFVNDTEQLNDLLQELEGKIESDKNELAQVKMEFDENKNKMEDLRSKINDIGYEISDGEIKIRELGEKIVTDEIEQNEVSSVLESRQEFDLEKLQPLINEHKKVNIKIDQIKVGRGPHADYSNEKQTLFNLQDKIEEEIRIYYNSDFDSSKLYFYKPKKLISAEWKELETTNVESTHQSVQAKKENQGNNTLHNCRHCQGYGCLRCNDTGYDGH